MSEKAQSKYWGARRELARDIKALENAYVDGDAGSIAFWEEMVETSRMDLEREKEWQAKEEAATK